MAQRLIATVPAANGFVEKYYWDDDRPQYDRLHIVREQDVEQILEENRAESNSLRRHGENFGSAPIHHVARIPFATLERWRTEEGFDWFNSTDAEKRKQLNKPENRKYRTRQSKM